MFKLLVIVLLYVIAVKACSADINVVTANVPTLGKSYIYYNINGHSDAISVPFALPFSHWSY